MKTFIVSILSLLLIAPLFSQQYLAVVRQGRQYGYIDLHGEMVISPRFEHAKDFKDGLAMVRELGKWGFIDRQGKSVIHPQFQDARPFHNGMAMVYQNRKWKYCDKDGKLIALNGETKIFNFSEGLGRVFHVGPDKWGFVDKDGNWPVPAQFQKAGDFSEGLAAVMERDKWGYIDRKGKWVVDPKFEVAHGFKEGLGRVRLNGIWCFTDREGKIISPFGVNRAFDFSEGLAVARRGKKTGFVDKSGKWVIEPILLRAESFSDGKARAQEWGTDKWGFIDRTGKWIVQPKYVRVKDFSEGLAMVQVRKTWGFINESGEMVIEPLYASSGHQRKDKGFTQGLARVKHNKRWGFLNKKGELLNGRMYDGVEPYQATFGGDEPVYTENKVAPRKVQQTYAVEDTRPEPKYRGSGDPLKGLGVSSAEDMLVGDYYALIIGVDRYEGVWASLENAVHDARTIEQLLRSEYKFDHFKTLYNESATRKNIIKEMEWLVTNVREIDNLLIYYSGHGEFKQNLNKGYWVPVDATTESTSEYVSNNDIQTFLNGIRSKHTLLISDACFSGDIFRGKAVSVPFEDSDRYYKEVHNLASRQAITSGGIEPVMDGGRDGHSVFAYYLLKSLISNQQRYFDASQLFGKIKIPVYNNSEQSPKFSPIKNTGDEGGQFIFIKR